MTKARSTGAPRRRRLSMAVLVAAVAIAAMPAAQADEWPVGCARTDVPGGEWRQFGNQLTGDRAQTQEHFLNAPRAALLAPAWTFDANRASRTENNEVTGYPVVADGCVYVGTSTGFQTPGWVFSLNADTGEVVWRRQLDRGVYATVAVENGLVYAFVSKVKLSGDATVGGPYVIALDQATGETVWQTTVDYQVGSDAVSSPVVYDGLVWVGVSATAAEGNEGDRGQFQGSFVLLDAQSGAIIRKTYSIPPDLWEEGWAGGAQWGTIAIDPETGYGYEGTGNPFNFDREYETTNAVIKVDLARARDAEGNPIPGSTEITNPDFAKVLGSYKGEIEEYYPGFSETVPCDEVEEISGAFAAGIECLRLDLDFGAQPNIFEDADGRRLVGIGQKSGVYHVFDAATMEPVWKQILGVPSPVGGIVGSAAYDGTDLYGPHTLAGYLWSIGKNDGALNWVAPVGDAVHWGNPTTIANRIVYTVDLKGFLDAYDAATGAPLLHRPLGIGSEAMAGWHADGQRPDPTLTWGGTTIARNTVYASIGVGVTSAEIAPASMPNGYVIAYKPFVNPPI